MATILVAITIGAGIYSTPQLVARHIADLEIVLACWVVGGIFALLGALVYAEVGSRIPDTGGEYVYLRRVFGPWAGFVVGWLDFFLVAPNARVGLALVTAAYVAPAAGPVVRVTIAASTLVALCAITYLGVGPSMAAQRSLVVLKVAGLLVLSAAVLRLPAPEAAAGFSGTEAAASGATADPTVGGLAAAMLLVVFTYLGWQYMVSAAGEVRSPSRSLPLGLIGGIGAVMLLNVITVWTYYRALGPEGVAAADGVAAAAGAVAFGLWGGAFVTAVVVASTLSSMSGSIMAHSRIAFAAARDGALFRGLDAIHPTFGTPSRAVLAHLVVCLVLLAVRQSMEVAFSALAFGRFIFMAMVALSLFRLRRQEVGGGRVFRVPLYPLLPAVFLAGSVLLLISRVVLQPAETLLDIAILIGALAFLPLARRWGWNRGARRSELEPDSSLDA